MELGEGKEKTESMTMKRKRIQGNITMAVDFKNYDGTTYCFLCRMMDEENDELPGKRMMSC